MVTAVYIKKYTVKDSVIYYHVEVPEEKQDFFIGIDLPKKILIFYPSIKLDYRIKKINLAGSDVECCEVPGTNSHIANFVIVKAYSAIAKNEFPENMNYNFH